MGIQKARTIGSPGVPGKWIQPAGTSYYSFSMSRVGGIGNFILRNDQFGDDGSNVIRVKNSYSNWTAENTVVILSELFREFASRSWSSAPATPSIGCRVNLLQNMTGSTETVEDTLTESITCDPADIQIARARIGKRIYQADGSGFAPNVRMRTVDDVPTVQTICTWTARISGFILLPTAGISSVPGATAYPSFNLTLINEKP